MATLALVGRLAAVPSVRDLWWMYSPEIGYPQRGEVTKRLVDIDDELLEQAAAGYEDPEGHRERRAGGTVKAARRRTITHEDLRIFADAARDLGDPPVMAKAWE